MLGRRWLCWIVGTLTLGERAAAILRDEIEHGALADIAAASQVWSTHHRDLLTPEATRRLAAEFGGLLDTVLDLLTPSPRSVAASSLPAPVAMPDHAADQGRQTIESLPVLRAWRSAPLGGAAEIHTRLRNDGPTPAEVGFVWSDLVAEPDGRIHAGCLRLLRPGASPARRLRRPRDWPGGARRRAARALSRAAPGHRACGVARAADVSSRP